jgi:pimeloyl-ACP methyl ester carboxylesterase
MTTPHRKLHIARYPALVALAVLQLMTAWAGPVAARTPTASTEAARVQSRLITLSSGVTLNYVVQGDSKGRPVVLIHGVGDSWHSYERVLPLLPPSLRVYAVTLRGHGWSDHPPSGYARADFAGDIAEFLKALDLHRVVLVGHSLGSFVAEQVAADDDGRIDKLVLIGAGPGTVPDPVLRRSLIDSFERLQDPVDFTFARDFQASTIHAPVPPAFFETMVAEALKAPAATWHGIAAGWRTEEDGTFLQRIRIPTLLLWGDHDEIFPRPQQDALVRSFGNARLVQYADTGHALHWERPERFAVDLQRFVAERRGAPSSQVAGMPGTRSEHAAAGRR